MPDPGNPDTVYLECAGVTGGALIIKVKFVTDNVGDTNRIIGIGVPLRITNSNPAASPVLDTSPAVTFSGSVVEDWESRGTFVVSIIDSINCDTFLTCVPAPSPCSIEQVPQPGWFCLDDTTFCHTDSITCDTFESDPTRTFPTKFGVSALTFNSTYFLGAGGYFYGNAKVYLEDTTTICVDTFSYQAYKLHFTKYSTNGYIPQWRGICCKVVTTDFGYKPGDANCSGGNPNLSDIIYLINYVFKGGPRPCIGKLGDANCSGGKPNLTDVVYLVNYVFKGGNAPIPCP